MAWSSVFADDFAGPAGERLIDRPGWVGAGANGRDGLPVLSGTGQAGSAWFSSSITFDNLPLVVAPDTATSVQRITITIGANSGDLRGGALFAWDAATKSGYHIRWRFSGNEHRLTRVDNGVETDIQTSAAVISSMVTGGVSRLRAGFDADTDEIVFEFDEAGDNTWIETLRVADTTYRNVGTGLVFPPAISEHFASFEVEEFGGGGGGGGVSGDGAGVLAAARSNGSASLRISGAAAGTVQALTADGAGALRLISHSDASLAAAVTAASGTVRATGSASAIAAALSANNMQGGLRVSGGGAGGMSSLRSDATGALAIDAVGASVLAALTASGAAGAISGVAAAVMGAARAQGAAELGVTGAAATAMTAAVMDGAGLARLSGDLASAMAALGADASGGIVVAGATGAEMSAAGADADGVVSIAGAVDVILSALEAAGTDTTVNIEIEVPPGRRLAVTAGSRRLVLEAAPRRLVMAAAGRQIHG